MTRDRFNEKESIREDVRGEEMEKDKNQQESCKEEQKRKELRRKGNNNARN